MMRWLVMPRGINVGKINRVPMAELVTRLEGAGFKDVITIGQSGNIIVTAAGPEEKVCVSVRALMASAFGVDVPVMVRSADEIRAILDEASDHLHVHRPLSGTGSRAGGRGFQPRGCQDSWPHSLRLDPRRGEGHACILHRPGEALPGHGDRSELEHAGEDRGEVLTAASRP